MTFLYLFSGLVCGLLRVLNTNNYVHIKGLNYYYYVYYCILCRMTSLNVEYSTCKTRQAARKAPNLETNIRNVAPLLWVKIDLMTKSYSSLPPVVGERERQAGTRLRKDLILEYWLIMYNFDSPSTSSFFLLSSYFVSLPPSLTIDFYNFYNFLSS